MKMIFEQRMKWSEIIALWLSRRELFNLRVNQYKSSEENMIGIFCGKNLNYLSKTMKSHTWGLRVIQGQSQLGLYEDLWGTVDGILMVRKPCRYFE